MPTTRAKYVLNGYKTLSDDEKKWLIDSIVEYQEQLQKGIIKEGQLVPWINLGPLPGPCACCGR